jgi:hypothetical protein
MDRVKEAIKNIYEGDELKYMLLCGLIDVRTD